METFANLSGNGILPVPDEVIFALSEKPELVYNKPNPFFSTLFGIDISMVAPKKAGSYSVVKLVLMEESGQSFNYFERNGKIWVVDLNQRMDVKQIIGFIEFCTR